MRASIRVASLCLLGLLSALPSPVRATDALKRIGDFTAGMQRMDGLLPLYWDAAGGKLYLELPHPGEQLLFFTTLTQGLGSNDVGLDRGQVADAKLVRLERIGPKVLLVQPNQAFRADSDDPDERLATEQSFASSVLWGFKVVAVSGQRVLVDATGFVVRDGHGAIDALAKAKQGKFKLDASRSDVYLPGTKAFPRNSEMEAILTLDYDDKSQPGEYVRDVTPTPTAITLRERYSFVALPPPGYMPRVSVPGDGYFEIAYADYAAPLGVPLVKHFIERQRLTKKNPGAALSDPVEPIVYYLDRGAPEPIRQALLTGARWWNQAFTAAGYRDAFRVELLPKGVDPMDARYNVIQWVHRATRGWSYGASIVDPRTGEIIKANITLGSLRARYDYLLAEGLLSPYTRPGQIPGALQRFAMARLSQLAAHELGHTLGLAHNYIASTEKRASVMDYPVPLISLTPGGELDLANAYATGIGAWDKVTIDYGYQDFPAGTDTATALDKILTDARARGLHFMTDQDARPAGAADPQVNLWDNGVDMAAELRHVMKVRAVALQHFGANAIRRGMPLATIEDALVPIYLFHRYQVDATAKTLGGLEYDYALRGDGQRPTTPVSAKRQLEALDALLTTLAPEALALPPSLIAQIPPRPPGYPFTRELFARYTGLTFDPLTPAATAADLTLINLLQPQRDARLVEQHAMDPSLPGLAQVVDRLIAATFDTRATDGYRAEILRAEQTLLVQHLMDLAADADMPQVRAVAALKLDQLRRRAAAAKGGDEAEQAHRFALASAIRRFEKRPAGASPLPKAPVTPPGSPLGD
ncbi:MAG: zinc-dependent metalloprotease [Gammaproteobacteria bacterium]|nr:zinc-dependent metalloprotease [Gammaproteobacteria bacterium]